MLGLLYCVIYLVLGVVAHGVYYKFDLFDHRDEGEVYWLSCMVFWPGFVFVSLLAYTIVMLKKGFQCGIEGFNDWINKL